jgi:hypothetical protein
MKHFPSVFDLKRSHQFDNPDLTLQDLEDSLKRFVNIPTPENADGLLKINNESQNLQIGWSGITKFVIGLQKARIVIQESATLLTPFTVIESSESSQVEMGERTGFYSQSGKEMLSYYCFKDLTATLDLTKARDAKIFCYQLVDKSGESEPKWINFSEVNSLFI